MLFERSLAAKAAFIGARLAIVSAPVAQGINAHVYADSFGTPCTDPSTGSDNLVCVAPRRPRIVAYDQSYQPVLSNALLRAHVLAPNARHDSRRLHGIPAERLAELLIQNDLDEGRHALLLCFA